MRSRSARLMLAALTSAGFASCGGSNPAEGCRALPCPLPLAVEISVTAADGGPVDGVSIRVTGAATGSASCNPGAASSTTCYVPGVAGTYVLDVGASGFQSAQRTVAAAGTTPECGCPTVERAHVDVALTRNP
jgi:hypothetical protein